MQLLKNGKRKQVPHRRREAFGGGTLIVTVHLLDGLPSLRTQPVLEVVLEAMRVAKERFGCRVLEFTLLENHVHFLVEAPDEKALGRFMKGMLVRLSKALGKLWGRQGCVFERRFHCTRVTTMRQVHRGLRYVLNNARKHGIEIPPGQPDPFSSAAWFRHWRERRPPFRTDESPVAPPQISILVELVHVTMPVGINDMPGVPLEAFYG